MVLFKDAERSGGLVICKRRPYLLIKKCMAIHRFTIGTDLSILHCAADLGRSICYSRDRCFTQEDMNLVRYTLLRPTQGMYQKLELVFRYPLTDGVNFPLNTSASSCRLRPPHVCGREQKMTHKKSRQRRQRL